jgi:hypothetical protein
VREITWPQLVVLMALGDGPEPSLRGTVRSRDVRPADDDEPADLEIPGQGRFQLREGSVRVLKRGILVRRERPDGRPFVIQGADTMWIWEGANTVPTAFPRGTAAWGWPDSPLTQRRGMGDWGGDDFTQATGPPTQTRFLGRDAWQVELRPPPHKPFPLTLIVDAATGLVLQQRNDGFHSVAEWEELEFGVDLADELFTWEGESQPPPDHRAEHEADMARRREWLQRNGVGALSLTLPVELMVHEQSDDGAFQASLRANLDGSLARRRHSDEPWALFMNWPHMHRWSDGEWDWWLGTNGPLPEELLAAITSQFGDSSA